MGSIGVEVVGVLFGMVDGARIEPLAEHDSLCRKEDDQMKYHAPVYIFEDGDVVVKLPDLGKFPSTENYADEVSDIISSVLSK